MRSDRGSSDHLSLRALDSDRSRSGAAVSFGSKDLVVVRSQLLAVLGPSIKVGLNVDRTTNTLLLPDRPELLEGRGTIDRRLVGTGGLENVVSATVSGNGTLLLSSRTGVVRAVSLDNVVLDQRITSPAVERDVRVDIAGIPGTRVGDVADTAGVPALTSDEVADVGPLDIVLFISQLLLFAYSKKLTYGSACTVIVVH
jgi:hypothetical protein